MHTANWPSAAKNSLLKIFFFLFMFCATAAIESPAQTLTTLASFNFNNGAAPVAQLVQGTDGNFYGTTQEGGNIGAPGFCSSTNVPGCGGVFKVSPAGVLMTLYLFCAQSNCPDGSEPSAGLVQGPDGNFYGTTVYGGANDTNCQYGCGTIFKITPSGALTTLYSFCSQANCADGIAPWGTLVLGSDGNFYGTTAVGGGPAYSGTVFKITPQGALTTLHTFNFTDGDGPHAGLVQAADGSFYGTTENGGTYNAGTTFKVTSAGVFTMLHSFDGTDGSIVEAGLIQATDGNFYGAASAGGGMNSGTVFKMTPGGVLTPLHSFCLQSSCPDGYAPQALVQGTDGNLYGVTPGGGTPNQCISGCGTIFKMTTAGALTTIYDFDGNDGWGPSAALLQATDGKFYGTTFLGGPCEWNHGCGTIFSLNVGLAPFVTTQPTSGTVGAPVTILGTNLSGATGVSFNGTAATFNVVSDSEITTTVPVGATTGPVQVTVPSGTLDSNTEFRVVGPGQFVAVTPCRLVDTRNGNPIQGGTYQSFTLPQLGNCSIPTSAAAYSLNVTAVPHGRLGYLTIWGTGASQPLVSTLNSPDGRVKANAAIVPAGTNGAVSVYVTDTSDVILDIDGYFITPGSQTLQFYPLTPCRVVDTRADSNEPQGLGPPSLHDMETRELPILSTMCPGLPANPAAYSFNVTAVPYPAGQSENYVTLWPSDQQQPGVSTLNNYTATVVANAAIVPAATNGDVSVFAYNSTDLIIDINGYFAAPGTGGYSFYPVAPCRAYDSRDNDGQPFTGERTVNIAGSPCASPGNAAGYVFNATVVPSPRLGYLTLWADGQTQPVVSTLNAYDGFITSNMAIVPNVNGSIDAYADGMTHLILDISGYFAP